MSDISDRLVYAFGLGSFKSIRSFANAIAAPLAARNAPGGRYASVHGYLSGKTRPSVAFIEEAARLLRVSHIWLAFGQGVARPADPIDHAEQLREWTVLDYTYCPHCGQVLPEVGE